MFGGNAALALDWLTLIRAFRRSFPASPAHFLLIDYPGYGQGSGSPSPATLLDTTQVPSTLHLYLHTTSPLSSDIFFQIPTQAALAALALEMRLPLAAVHARLHILGHSLGGAAGLQLVRL